MDREYLESKKKDDLIEIILKYQEEISRLKDEVYSLQNNVVKNRFNENMYSEYLDMKENLEIQSQNNIFNNSRIRELEDLLDRYKNIVDKLGGSREV